MKALKVFEKVGEFILGHIQGFEGVFNDQLREGFSLVVGNRYEVASWFLVDAVTTVLSVELPTKVKQGLAHFFVLNLPYFGHLNHCFGLTIPLGRAHQQSLLNSFRHPLLVVDRKLSLLFCLLSSIVQVSSFRETPKTAQACCLPRNSGGLS